MTGTAPCTCCAFRETGVRSDNVGFQVALKLSPRNSFLSFETGAITDGQIAPREHLEKLAVTPEITAIVTLSPTCLYDNYVVHLRRPYASTRP
jgi:hypothetical protein